MLDEASRPSAPEPPQGVAFPAPAAGRHLVEVHDHYRAELARVRDVLEQVRAGAAHIGEARSAVNAVALRANSWTLGGYCQVHCAQLTQHHTMEDGSIFPHLRRGQQDLGPVLDRLEEEHHAIHELIEEVDASLVHLAAHPGDLGPLTEVLDLLTDALLSHFAYEERELVGPLSRFGFYAGQV